MGFHTPRMCTADTRHPGDSYTTVRVGVAGLLSVPRQLGGVARGFGVVGARMRPAQVFPVGSHSTLKGRPCEN